MRKQGRALSAAEYYLLQPYFQSATLKKARLIEGHTPFWLSKSMCAVVLGHRIYFRQCAYQADTLRGIELLAHELTHVEQYLTGMNIFKYIWVSRKGYKANPYEIEAYAKGAAIRLKVSQTQTYA